MDRKMMQESTLLEMVEMRWFEVIAIGSGLIHACSDTNLDIVR